MTFFDTCAATVRATDKQTGERWKTRESKASHDPQTMCEQKQRGENSRRNSFSTQNHQTNFIQKNNNHLFNL